MRNERLAAGAARTTPERLPGHPLPLVSVKPRLWFSRAMKHSILQDASCFSYLDPEKSYGACSKNFFAAQNSRSAAILIPEGAASTSTFACLPGLESPLSHGNQRLGCVQMPNG